MTRLAKIAATIGDRANPIVVKELRQAVQSRLVIAILLVFLLVNVFVVCSFLMLNADANSNETAGQELFAWLFVVLALTCLVFVPLYAGIRLTMERNDANIDLLFTTTIAPAAIIRGKFWAAVALIALIYSACMPFLTFTYLLRGIDLPSIFASLAIAFACTAGVTMLAIFVGSVAGGWLLRLLLAGAFLFAWCWITTMVIVGCMQLARMGLTFMFNDREAWAVFGCVVLFGLCAWGFFYLLAVASISARSSNRMLPVRVFVTACWIVFGLIMGVWSWIEESPLPMGSWLVTSVMVVSVVLVFVLAERESWSPRVRRAIPRGRLPRFVAWLLFTGSAGGVLWCFTLGAVTLLAAIAANGMLPRSHLGGIRPEALRDSIAMMTGALLYAVCYAMTGLLVRRWLAPKSPPILGAVLACILFAVGCLAPLLLAYLIEGPLWRFDTLPIEFVLTNPAVLEREFARYIVLYFLMIWAIVATGCNFRWFRQQWSAFARHELKPAEPQPVALAEPAPAVAHG
ncbi:MAG TPA: hypothetical protein VHD36_04160 [Pirellulales bacterium]|nr:hypothetical protein [Pirellulales bacterium]